MQTGRALRVLPTFPPETPITWLPVDVAADVVSCVYLILSLPTISFVPLLFFATDYGHTFRSRRGLPPSARRPSQPRALERPLQGPRVLAQQTPGARDRTRPVQGVVRRPRGAPERAGRRRTHPCAPFARLLPQRRARHNVGHTVVVAGSSGSSSSGSRPAIERRGQGGDGHGAYGDGKVAEYQRVAVERTHFGRG